MVLCFRSRVSVLCVSPVYNLVGVLCRIALRAFGLCLTQRSQTQLTPGLGQTKQQKCPKPQMCIIAIAIATNPQVLGFWENIATIKAQPGKSTTQKSDNILHDFCIRVWRGCIEHKGCVRSQVVSIPSSTASRHAVAGSQDGFQKAKKQSAMPAVRSDSF